MSELTGKFVLKAPYKPSGDQPQAIEALAAGVKQGMDAQVLLGVTGSGKTFTMASVIEKVQRPTLVIAHNKTLAAQLCSELKAFFPDSCVEYFVSYYDYYQPEAYIASSDTYIEKDASINEEIDRMRHSATAALRERRDVIIVASVSCIYSMGDPSEYEGQMISLRPGMAMARDELLRQLIDIQNLPAFQPEAVRGDLFQRKKVIHQTINGRDDHTALFLCQKAHHLHPLFGQKIPMNIRAVEQKISGRIQTALRRKAAIILIDLPRPLIIIRHYQLPVRQIRKL